MPRTLAQNAEYIANTIKPAIKSAIEAQGVTVPSTDSFLDYADRIAEIEGGGSGYQLKDLPTGSIATVTDAAELPLNALKVSVEAWQEGTGDPSPSNIRPIHGWDSGEIGVVGKNFLDNTKIKHTNPSTGQSNSKWLWWDEKIPCRAGQEFILNCNVEINSIYIIAIDYYDISNNKIASDNKNYKNPNSYNFIVPSQNAIKYMVISFYHGSALDSYDFSNSQLELGSTATTYEPYQGKQYTLDFPQTIYGAEWDVVSGELDNQYGVVDLGSLNYIYQSDNHRFVSTTQVPNMKYAPNGTTPFNGDCENMSVIATDDTLGNVGEDYGVANGLSDSLLRIRYQALTDPTAFKTAMQGVKLKYELATPTTINLSPLSIRMLQGTNNVFVDCGEVIEGEYFIGETKAYDLVEYIESDGTQVIDTGRQVVQGQTIEVTFEGSSNQTAYAWIFGGITSSDYYGYQFPNSSAVYLYNGGTSASSQSGFSSDVLTQKALTFNGSINANIHILGLLDGSTYTNKGKFKVYFLDINGDYFVPAKRRRDGAYGLYDIVNSQFLTDVASGNALTGGASLGIRIG